ncbi:MAG: hypothetical protein JSS26_14855 [Nitrospira sp.]|nr:hypothetical protein [Nitrospira sp.]
MMSPLSYSKALSYLTLQSNKVQAYEDDFVPEEAWRTICRHWRDSSAEFLFGYSFLVLKPEAIARRLSWRAISFVADRGFVPVAQVCVPISRNVAHHIWRYQWNAATTDRIELTNMVNAQSDSLLVVLRDTKPGAVPASVKLWHLKGSAHAERRTSDHLRTTLGMHNRMLGFVHTPDEPADLVRELSILFDPIALGKLLGVIQPIAASRTDLMAICRRQVTEIESQCAVHSVNPAEVMERLGLNGACNRLPGVTTAISSGRKMGLVDVLDEFQQAGDRAFFWDALTIAAELVEHDRKGVSPKLDARAVNEMLVRWSNEGSEIQAALKNKWEAT